jgi:hypothetical protein
MQWNEVNDGVDATFCDIISMEHSKFYMQELSIYIQTIVN